MRLLFKLRALGDFAYDLSYYSKMQGFLYSTIRSLYPDLHEKKGFKFFCFSNIFPIGDFGEGDVRSFLVSSPDSVFIKALRHEFPAVVRVGEMCFSVEDVRPVSPSVDGGCVLMAATPIVVRIPSYNFGRYGIDSDKGYVFWRSDYSFEAFVKQLEENLFKKYNDFHNVRMEEQPLFDQYRLKKKPVCCHIPKDGSTYQVIGSLWEFPLQNLTKIQRKVLGFGLDAGFGELNTQGFGFINPVNN